MARHPRPLSESPSRPSTKRLKTKEEAKFREGFILVHGAKPKASDYAPVPHAVLLRTCADYSARVLTTDVFPTVALQLQWSSESWRSACCSAKERIILSDRMIKVVVQRGSQICGKRIEKYRALFPSHYGFERSTSKKVIAANKVKAEKLLLHGSFHYKKTDTRTGFAGNKIISAVRQLTTFKDLNRCFIPRLLQPNYPGRHRP